MAIRGPKKAFEEAGAPLRNPRNFWSSVAPDESFIAISMWQHEIDRFGSTEPLLGPGHAGASWYFRNTPEYIDEWAGKRDAAGRRPIDSAIGWRAMKEHLRLAKGRSLPVRAVVVQACGLPDGAVRAKIKRADYKPDWRLEVTFLDPSTGAFELAVFGGTTVRS